MNKKMKEVLEDMALKQVYGFIEKLLKGAKGKADVRADEFCLMGGEQFFRATMDCLAGTGACSLVLFAKCKGELFVAQCNLEARPGLVPGLGGVPCPEIGVWGTLNHFELVFKQKG